MIKGMPLSKKKSSIILGIMFALGLALPTLRVTAASADTSTVSCDKLTQTLSPDNKYDIFTVKSSVPRDAVILSYIFNFGDKQTYSFNFESGTSGDRDQATVNHTYEKAGNYDASVSVLAHSGNRTFTVTSPSCNTSVAFDQPAINSLVNTGPGDMLSVLAVTVPLGYFLHARKLTLRSIQQ